MFECNKRGMCCGETTWHTKAKFGRMSQKWMFGCGLDSFVFIVRRLVGFCHEHL